MRVVAHASLHLLSSCLLYDLEHEHMVAVHALALQPPHHAGGVDRLSGGELDHEVHRGLLALGAEQREEDPHRVRPHRNLAAVHHSSPMLPLRCGSAIVTRYASHPDIHSGILTYRVFLYHHFDDLSTDCAKMTFMYNHKEIEKKWQQRFESAGVFR